MIVKTINRVVENITKENKYRQLYCDVARGVIEYRSKSCEKYYLDIPRSRVEQWIAQNSKDEVKVVFTPANVSESATLGSRMEIVERGLRNYDDSHKNTKEVNFSINTKNVTKSVTQGEV